MAASPFTLSTLDALTIDDERSFRHVALYGDLKDVLLRAKYPFRVLAGPLEGRADRALLLNLTFWGAAEGGDILESSTLPADVVAHAAWHHLAARQLPAEPKASVASLFLGESIASAFDLYLVGRLLGHAPSSSFLETQVPAMADAADATGMGENDFESMLEGIATDPERAFADLRDLLFDATTALYAAGTPADGASALAAFDGHRFASILHRYELSNWVLYARAYGDPAPDPRARGIDEHLRKQPIPLEWLTEAWVRPALT